ncbi:MAG TPA: tetratricopeptide repeat protein, partial [Allosphingosinicella sp.]
MRLAGAAWVLIGMVAAAEPLHAAEVAPPVVGAPNPAAFFSATSGAVEVDRECLAYTVDTVSSHAGCAALVSQGKLTAILPVVSRTVMTPGAGNPAAAIAMLQKAVGADPHPAGFYLLGNLLATGERIKPDYSKAVAYLRRAASGGNFAAADLLGTLHLAGKGVAQDAAKAAALFEQAMAGGMHGSARRLAMLYLDGRWFPRDPDRARVILEAAQAAGHTDAGTMLFMLQGEDKVHNFQLLPAGEGKAPELREYKTFDNPAIPPALGFTEEFQKLYFAAYSDPSVVARLERDLGSLPTPFIYELARRAAADSPEKARGYWMLARTRMSFDVARCKDPAAIQAVNAFDALVLPEIRYALAGMSPAETKAAVDFALER